MTNREAVAATIEPYGVSDDALDKALIDAGERFGDANPDNEYTTEGKKSVAFAAMLVLVRMKVLQSENIGGISQNYAVSKIDAAIKAIAADAGISADLVLEDDTENTINCISI